MRRAIKSSQKMTLGTSTRDSITRLNKEETLGGVESTPRRFGGRGEFNCSNQVRLTLAEKSRDFELGRVTGFLWEATLLSGPRGHLGRNVQSP